MLSPPQLLLDSLTQFNDNLKLINRYTPKTFTYKNKLIQTISATERFIKSCFNLYISSAGNGQLPPLEILLNQLPQLEENVKIHDELENKLKESQTEGQYTYRSNKLEENQAIYFARSRLQTQKSKIKLSQDFIVYLQGLTPHFMQFLNKQLAYAKRVKLKG